MSAETERELNERAAQLITDARAALLHDSPTSADRLHQVSRLLKQARRTVRVLRDIQLNPIEVLATETMEAPPVPEPVVKIMPEPPAEATPKRVKSTPHHEGPHPREVREIGPKAKAVALALSQRNDDGTFKYTHSGDTGLIARVYSENLQGLEGNALKIRIASESGSSLNAVRSVAKRFTALRKGQSDPYAEELFAGIRNAHPLNLDLDLEGATTLLLRKRERKIDAPAMQEQSEEAVPEVQVFPPEVAETSTVIAEPEQEKPIKINRTRTIVIALLEPNSDNTEFKTIKLRDIAALAYADSLIELEGKAKTDKISSYTGALTILRGAFVNHLQKIGSGEELSPSDVVAKELLDDIVRHYPIYKDQTVQQMIDLLLRKGSTPFPTFKEERGNERAMQTAEFERRRNLAQARRRRTSGEPSAAELLELETRSRANDKALYSLEGAEKFFGNRRDRVLSALLALTQTETGTDFLYSNLEAIALAVYGDQRKAGRGLDALERVTRQSREHFVQKLAEYGGDPTKIDAEMESLLTKIYSMPEYDGLNWVRLAKVLRRQIAFSKLRDPDPKFDKFEVRDGIIITNIVELPSCADGTQKPGPHTVGRPGHLPPPELINGNRHRRQLKEGGSIIPLPELPADKPTLRETMIYSLMLVDPSGKDYLYPTLGDLTAHLTRITPMDKRRPRNPGKYQAHLASLANEFMDLLATYDGDAEKSHDQFLMDEFIEWAAKQPIYETYSPSTLTAILTRGITCTEVLEVYKKFAELNKVSEGVSSPLPTKPAAN